MPLKLKPPRPGKTPHWYVRGTYLGQRVDRTTKTASRAKAAKILARIKAEIERGEFSRPGDPVFADAAIAYVRGGGEGRFLGPIAEHFGRMPLTRIDQAAIDAGAVAAYPAASPATRNRQWHTPIAAVLHHAGVEIALRRPAGSEGNKRTDWLWPENAFRIFRAARTLDEEFEIFLTVLCYCGPRLGEATDEMLCDFVRLPESFAYLGHTKNGEPRGVHLPPPVVAALARHPRGLDRPGERVFRFRKGGRLYKLLRAVLALAGADLAWVTFHTFCHTYATWMRRYGGLDSRGLLATGRWADLKSVQRYEHVVATEESRRADRLPVEPPERRREKL